MVYLLVNTSIKVCSLFFLPERCRFFEFAFLIFFSHSFSCSCCCCAVVFLRGFFSFSQKISLLLISRNFFHMLQKPFSRGMRHHGREQEQKKICLHSLSTLHTWSFNQPNRNKHVTDSGAQTRNEKGKIANTQQEREKGKAKHTFANFLHLTHN